MANILVAQTRVYGKEENIDAFLGVLREHLYFTEVGHGTDLDGNVIERDLQAEFRWNIEGTLTKPEILQATKDYSIGIEAMGHEPSMGFYEVVSVKFGVVLDSQLFDVSFDSAYFDPNEVDINKT